MPQPGDWTPFDNEVQFQLADLIYCRAELSASNVDALLELWAQSVQDLDAFAPFKNHDDIYVTIDSSVLGDVPWQCMVTVGLPSGKSRGRDKARHGRGVTEQGAVINGTTGVTSSGHRKKTTEQEALTSWGGRDE
jgi:hypothetical protein